MTDVVRNARICRGCCSCMFENKTTPERIALAKAKMQRALDHFLYLLELHTDNEFIVYAPYPFGANSKVIRCVPIIETLLRWVNGKDFTIPQSQRLTAKTLTRSGMAVNSRCFADGLSHRRGAPDPTVNASTHQTNRRHDAFQFGANVTYFNRVARLIVGKPKERLDIRL